MDKVILRPHREDSILRFHPWVFSGAIAEIKGTPSEGDLVSVHSSDGQYLATGHYQIGSIAVRILSFDEDPLAPDFWEKMVRRAFQVRVACGLHGSAATNCYRLVHGEGDGLPGLIIDHYDGVCVLQAHSVGMFKALFDYKGTAKMMLSPSRSHVFNPRLDDIDNIMKIIGQAKRRMKERGLDQWQDGYPDEETIRNDKRKHQAHIVMKWFGPAAYAAIVFGKDPYYEKIDGQWLSDDEPYVTVHRLAVADEFTGLDLARHILRFAERKARAKGVRWFRIDTHHDNLPMRNLIRDFGFTFCGVVQVRDGKRMAYEKRVAMN